VTDRPSVPRSSTRSTTSRSPGAPRPAGSWPSARDGTSSTARWSSAATTPHRPRRHRRRRGGRRYRPASRTLGSSVCRRSESMSLSRPTTSSSTRSSADGTAHAGDRLRLRRRGRLAHRRRPARSGPEPVVDDAGAGATVLTGGRARPNVAPYCYADDDRSDVEPDATVACENVRSSGLRGTRSDADAAVAAANDSRTGSTRACGRGTGIGAPKSPAISTAAPSTSTTPSSRRGAPSTRQWVVSATPGWAAATGPGIRRYVESRTIGVSRVGPLTFPDRIPIGWFVRGAFAALSLRRRASRGAAAEKSGFGCDSS